MAATIRVELLGDHEYLVTMSEGPNTTESRVYASEAVLDALSAPESAESRIVHESMAFLTERQPVIDVPPMIDLDDLSSAYGDSYLRELNRRLHT